MDLYPEKPWKIWNFEYVAKELWTPDIEREFVEHIGKSLEIKQLDDWYSVKKTDFDSASFGVGAENYLNICHNGSLTKAITSVYPKHDWKLWKFTYSHKGSIFEEDSKTKQYLEWVSQELGITSLDDWYRITWTKLNTIDASSVIRKKYGGLVNLLKQFYPDHHWDAKRFQGHWKSQHSLFLCIQELLPDVDIHIEHPHPLLLFDGSKKEMTLDIYVPSLRLAFEYQGRQHYEAVFRYQDQNVAARDKEKREACEKMNLTLIEVPYWWDQKKESLIATINKLRPDINLNSI